ncbi:MAG: aminopeptidase [Bacteroidetes bacterium]|nr:MAG: aminopeptidase [Bacteroidota bacterium]REK07039.1 MAG: aminopeptidase [Bacteroidota bacterium]REK33614.1 MAG: aminopeptidase [Bacteroidota bacterium]REK48599.1 MAG: aminopeptidase [Bacteroidota bacterium]
MDLNLLKELCSIHAPSGNEEKMTHFILDYVQKHKSGWKKEPQIHFGDDFQNCIVLVFGAPVTAVFAHIDSIGFTIRYNRELVKIGGPHLESGTKLRGWDQKGLAECEVVIDDQNNIRYKSDRDIERGTDLSYAPIWKEDSEYVQCSYMDNRLGVWVALQLCETMEHGAIVFSCWEEHGGGSVPYLIKFLCEQHALKNALICDITWITEGVIPGKGVVISMRDTGIPRRKFLNKIIEVAGKSGIPFQLEVEGSGGSDGTEIQKQPYPVDWCFIGAAEQNVHTPKEKVHKKDIEYMLGMYRYLTEPGRL